MSRRLAEPGGFKVILRTLITPSINSCCSVGVSGSNILAVGPAGVREIARCRDGRGEGRESGIPGEGGSVMSLSEGVMGGENVGLEEGVCCVVRG